MIQISSKLEIVTMIFGWRMYGELWNLLQDTGLAFLPFLGMLINNFIQPITATYTTSAAQLSLKKVEWDLIRMLMVIVLAGQPFVDVQLAQYQLLDRCVLEGGELKPEQINTDFDPVKVREFGLSGKEEDKEKLKSTRVPLWWYAVQSVSTGFAEAAKRAVPCVEDARGMMTSMMSGVTANDAPIEQELQNFIDQCYTPTKSFVDGDAFKNNQYFKDLRAKYEAVKKIYGDDTTSLASNVFLAMGSPEIDKEIPGGHKKFYGQEVEIMGFKANDSPSRVDTVSCKEWWGDYRDLTEKDFHQLSNALRAPTAQAAMFFAKEHALFNEAPKKNMLKLKLVLLSAVASGKSLSLKTKVFNTQVANLYWDAWSKISSEDSSEKVNPVLWPLHPTPEHIKAGMIRIDNMIKDFITLNFKPNLTALLSSDEKLGGADWWKQRAASFGLLITAFGTYAGAYVMRESFPTIQALLLMGIFVFLGVGLVFSGYTLEFMYAGAVAIFTLKFMGFILYFCKWLDNNLIMFISPESASATASAWEMASALWSSTGFSRMVLDYSVAGLYTTLPALFATVMVWAGVRGAEVIGEAQKAASPMTQAAEKGAQMAQQMATGAVSTVGGGGLGAVAGGIVGGMVKGKKGIIPGAARGAGLGRFVP